eukprot:g3586.t1
MPPSEILDTLRGAVKSITAEPKVVQMDGVARAFDFTRDGVLKLDPSLLKIDPITLPGAVKSITAEPKVVPMDGVARAFDFIRDGVLKLDPRFLKIDPKVETAMNDAKKSLQAREEHPEAANLEVKLQAVRTILNQTIVLK